MSTIGLTRLVRYRSGLFAATLALWIVYSFYPLATGYLTREVFDALTGHTPARAWPLLGLLLVAEVAAALLGVGWLYAHLTFERTLEALVRSNLFGAVIDRMYLPLPVSSGDVVGRFRDDVEEAMGPINEWYRLAGEALFALVALGIMLRIDARITLLSVLPLAIVIVAVHRASARLGRYRQTARRAAGEVTGFLGEVFGGVLAIKLAGAESLVLQRLRDHGERRRRAGLRDVLYGELLGSFNWNVANLARAVVLLLAARSMATGRFTVGDFALFTVYLEWILELPRRVGRLLASRRLAQVSAERLADLSRDAHSLSEHRPVYLGKDLPDVPCVVKTVSDRLELLEVRGLTYQHPSSGRGVEEVSFELVRGEFVVITGRVGAGKTTVLRTLLGLLPKQAGEMRWNGELVEDPCSFFMAPRVAYVPQAPRLFSERLKDNIQMGLPETGIDMYEALRIAVLERDLERIPDGLETLVGPRGMRLSGGQVQRTATARALVRGPELLVVDDLSSALDVETEERLWEGIRRRTEGTVLAVSHRRAALRLADRIVMLENGRMTASGTLADLLSSCEEMRSLWRGQPSP